MNFQNDTLPGGAVKVGSTPSMTQDTVLQGLLQKHLAPKDIYGYLVIESGSAQFVWEDDADNVLDADPDHPVVIYPERFHHVVISGPVQLRVEFYKIESDDKEHAAQQGDRPGKDFI